MLMRNVKSEIRNHNALHYKAPPCKILLNKYNLNKIKMIKKLFKKKQGFKPVELILMVGFAALTAGALIYLGTTPKYMSSSSQPQDVNVNIKVDAASASRQPSAKAQMSTITVPTDYPTIAAAVEAASDGDTIMIEPGTYYEGIHLTKSLTFKGTKGPKPTGSNDPDTGKPLKDWPVKIKGFINLYTADYLNISDLSIDAVGSGQNFYGISNAAVCFGFSMPKTVASIDLTFNNVELIAEDSGIGSLFDPLGTVTVNDSYIETVGNTTTYPWQYKGNFGFSAMASQGSATININRSTLKSGMPIFASAYFDEWSNTFLTMDDKLYVNDCDLVANGYSAHGNSVGLAFMTGWETDTNASVSLKNSRIYMKAEPSTEPYLYSVGAGIGMPDHFPDWIKGWLGYNGHDATIENVKITGISMDGIGVYSTAHDSSYEDINLKELQVSDSYVHCGPNTSNNTFTDISMPSGGTVNCQGTNDTSGL